MKIEAIDHIGIAVNNLEESLSRWEKIFGLKGQLEVLGEGNIKLVHFHLKEGPSIELISPLNEESPITKFLRERGEGIHHFCFKVKDLEKAMAELRSKGVQFVQDKPQKGAKGSRIAFIHPRSINSVLIELKEENK